MSAGVTETASNPITYWPGCVGEPRSPQRTFICVMLHSFRNGPPEFPAHRVRPSVAHEHHQAHQRHTDHNYECSNHRLVGGGLSVEAHKGTPNEIGPYQQQQLAETVPW